MIKTIKRRHAISNLKAAAVFAENSYAKRLRVGAFLVKGDQPLSSGWNGRLPGEPNVCEDENNVTLPSVRHAEINALNKMRLSNESTKDAVMFITHSPCVPCAEEMVQSGIRAVVYEHPYRDVSGVVYLLNKGVQVYMYDSRLKKFFSVLLDAKNGVMLIGVNDEYWAGV